MGFNGNNTAIKLQQSNKNFFPLTNIKHETILLSCIHLPDML